MLNGPQSTNQIVNHFVNHSATQNNKVQLIKKVIGQNEQCQNRLVQNGTLVKLTNVIFGVFLTNFHSKKDHDLQQCQKVGHVFIINLLPHGHQMSHVPNSSHLIKPHNFHRPFASFCTTTNLFSTSSQIQTTNHALITLLILTNHTPTINAPYQPLTLHVNEASQPYTFPNPFDHA